MQTRPVIDMSDDEFFKFCQINRELHIEKTAEGAIVITSLHGGETGSQSAKFMARLHVWSKRDGTGITFASTGFILPNGATRAPDAAWVRRERLASLTPEQKQKFLPLCPNFVVELRSPSDRLEDLQAKMEEYRDTGAQLGWLIDPEERQVFVYRPGAPTVQMQDPSTLSGAPELPGFSLNLAEIWDPGC